jgi:hypothetical protein
MTLRLDVLRQDLRQAVRVLRRSPGLAAASIAFIAAGIGANATIFTLFDALLLRPLPVADRDRVVAVFTSDYSGPRYGTSSYADYLEFRQGAPALAGLAAYGPTPLALSADGGPGAQSRSNGPVERVLCDLVTDNYFDVVGLRPVLGRGFLAGEDRPGAVARVAVLGHALWQRRFGSDPGILGRHLVLSGHEFEVVGIAPPGFSGLTRGLAVDVWLPIGAKTLLQPGSNDLASRGSRSWFLMGRLREGARLPEACAARVVAAELFRTIPTTATSRARDVLPERSVRVIRRGAGWRSPCWRRPTGAVIACANLANLLLRHHAPPEMGCEGSGSRPWLPAQQPD